MKISAKGIDLIKKFEGCSLKAYRDVAGIITIGYGHTKGVKMIDVITEDQAIDFLYQDIEVAERAVNSYPQYSWNQNQFDALCSFAYNIGSIMQLTQNGRRSKAEVAKYIQAYVNAGGKKVEGLVRRRKAEYDLFMTPTESTTTFKIGDDYVVIVNGLRVRKAPTVDAPLGLKSPYNKGKVVRCYDVCLDTDGNIWIKICSQKSYYWICAKYNGKPYLR